MSQAVADSVKGRLPAVAVSNAWVLAPWADALASHDARWWQHNPEALSFSGRKFCGNKDVAGTERFKGGSMPRPCNSGLMGMHVAQHFGATSIVLLGFDMHGDHFFGRHPAPLRNTTDERRQVHLQQFSGWRGCAVFNATPGSAIRSFVFADLEDVIAKRI